MEEDRTSRLSEFGMRVYLFLEEYVDFPDDRYISELQLRDGIKLLVEENVFTAEALRMEALRTQRVIIPPRWVETKHIEKKE